MTRTFPAFLASGLIATGAALAAQTPTTTTPQSPATTTTSSDKWDAKEITVNGCVEKTKSGGYFLMTSTADRPGAATTTGTSGSTPPSSTTTAGATTTTTDSAAGKANAATWNLGQSDKLERYVGQRVEVVGRPERDTSGDQLKGTHGPGEIKARDIDVKSVTVLSPSCR